VLHLSARLHAFINELGRPTPQKQARRLHAQLTKLFEQHHLIDDEAREQLAIDIAEEVIDSFDGKPPTPDLYTLANLVWRIFNFEGMFHLPKFEWDEPASTTEYWELTEHLKEQKKQIDNLDRIKADMVRILTQVMHPIIAKAPDLPSNDRSGITVPTDLVPAISDLDQVVEGICRVLFDGEVEKTGLFKEHRRRLESNAVAASGGNPADPDAYYKPITMPTKSRIKEPYELIQAYLGGTPVSDLFDGIIKITIPDQVRFEHHHIVAGSGHGKTQTLQYLISEDLKAVERGERSIVVIDSQGDLINKIKRLKVFAPGEPLHDRVVIIDPKDVEWPVSLNLFDVGLERINQYSELDREQLINSILELYDFVLGKLLAAEMTQKQSVIFRYVTRLMLHIPDATIHTLVDLMQPGSEKVFAEHIAKLEGSAKRFFETEFTSKEFVQTKSQVLRRLWGILENRTFERMFSHPRSKLDMFREMNAGKVILINTAKDLLKETGTEIFGRFFIALIAQAAQERATLPENKRMPTMVYIDEAADYFDHNIGIILSQARKYKVGMVLAHQYLGQLDPKLQEAFAANTSIKFAGGVSAKDARALASMMHTTPELIEDQPKLSFAAYIRGVNRQALPLKFPIGHLEDLPTMSDEDWNELQTLMRQKYAVHYSELKEATNEGPDGEGTTGSETGDGPEGSGGNGPNNTGAGEADNSAGPDRPNTDPSPTW